MKNRAETPGLRPGTRAVHGPTRDPGGWVSTPVIHSATFSFPTLADMLAARDLRSAGAFYQRLGHPTLSPVEARLADLEGAEAALLFASGMAAISAAFLAHLRSGDHAVCLAQCYGGTVDVLRFGAERFGWGVALVDARAPETWEAAFRSETKLFHVETPSNPTLCVTDLAFAAELAHRQGALLTVDNTIGSPLGQRPLALGADLVMHSATKSIGGHSDLLAGVVMGTAQRMEAVWNARTIFGGVPDPSVAWLIERSLKTLALRVARANANALELARRLSSHARVAQVFYPGLEAHPGHDIARRQMQNGFGPLLSFDVKGGLAAAERCVDSLRVVRHAASLGGLESLACLPPYTSHRHMTPAERTEAGIPEGLVRVSIGIEDVEDLWFDLDEALNAE